jgi:hydrogenase expression/formation protein HypC
MCLAVPSRIVDIDPSSSLALVETMGVRRRVSIELLPEPVKEGDYVIVHVGYAISRLDEEDARESLRLFRELLAAEEDGQGG